MQQNKRQIGSIVDFSFELGQLKREQHVGWLLAGVRPPDSITEIFMEVSPNSLSFGCFRRANPYKSATMGIIHDNGEGRIGDHHKVSARYLDTGKAEQKAWKNKYNFFRKRLKTTFSIFLINMNILPPKKK
jgi:5'-deoxynucleotidase YfbR-like HD superfamily hydrolase